MTSNSTTEFWTWALDQYADADARDLLLALQETNDIIILEVMFVAWLGCQGRALDEELCRGLRASITPWVDSVVKPLRKQRQAWAEQANGSQLKTMMLAVELEAERQLADLLCAAFSSKSTPSGLSCVEANLSLIPELQAAPDATKRLMELFEG